MQLATSPIVTTAYTYGFSHIIFCKRRPGSWVYYKYMLYLYLQTWTIYLGLVFQNVKRVFSIRSFLHFVDISQFPNIFTYDKIKLVRALPTAHWV